MQERASVAEQTDQSDDDEINRDDVIQEPRHQQNQNSGDQGDQGAEGQVDVPCSFS